VGHVQLAAMLPVLATSPVTPWAGSWLGVRAVRAYQRWLSPRLPVRCRYAPTCSQYGLVAIRRYGLLAGSRLALARIRRCTPGVPPGTQDPVPAVRP
jgi:putative membrane protein insertion efficiency factor